MSTGVFNMPFTKSYVRHWGVIEALRELFQNQLDGDAPFEYQIRKDEDESMTLILHSRGITLEPRTLLLGATTKAENTETIGSFGEGYKMALLVLTREHRKVIVRNGEYIWTPSFIYSNQFREDILSIKSELASTQNDGLTFEISNLDAQEIEQIRESNLHMDVDIGQTFETSYGRILKDMKGKLFVNGLFVCSTELEYSYDIKPKYLRLERDRQTVSTFDLMWITKDMWFETDQFDLISQGIEADLNDFQYAHHGSTEIVRDACYKLFMSKNPGKIAVKSQEELNALIEKGMTNTVFVGESYYNMIQDSSLSKNAPLTNDKVLKPVDILKRFMELHKNRMGNKAVKDFNRMINEAEEGWRRGSKQVYLDYPFK